MSNGDGIDHAIKQGFIELLKMLISRQASMMLSAVSGESLSSWIGGGPKHPPMLLRWVR